MYFAPPKDVPTTVWSRVPDQFRTKRRTSWADANQRGAELDCFLEGPAFDREGNLWVVDVPFGRLFRIAPGGQWTLAHEYDGEPNGLAFHRDGRLFIADYRNGIMALEGVEPALQQAAALLERARAAGIPVFHIQHDAGPGSPYDIREKVGAIADPVAPRAGEPVIVKNYPNSFIGTDLAERIQATGRQDVVLAGFMTHMCVNSTARGAFNLGLRPTVEGDGRFHLEVHLFDFDRELYDAHLRVNFLHKLRDEAKYDSLDALTAQISRDCAQARNFLSQLS